jgi:Phospholipase_D-nuclease N-terminal
MGLWETLPDIVWSFFWSVALIAYLLGIFAVITDLFRDRWTSRGVTALWIVFLIFVPFLTVLVYVTVRRSTPHQWG